MKAPDEAGRARRALLRRPLAAGVVPLRRLDRWQAETLREQLADLYVESSHAKPGQEYRGREEFLRRLAADVRRPGFDMVIAQGTSLVGCAFGFPLARDGSWWQEFTGPLPENLEQLTASGHVFACAELMIHPHEHDRDVGLRLQDGLLAHQDASLGVTKLDRADAATCAAFFAGGWIEIGVSGGNGEVGEATPQTAPTRLRWLAVRLDARTRQNPDGLEHNARSQPPEGSAAAL